jgi:hypothetical protein
MNLIAGIAHGFIGWVSWGLARWLPGSLKTDFQRQALLAACRMFRIGAGVDDGACALMAGWGPEGHEALERLIDQGRLPARLMPYARFLLMVEPGDDRGLPPE